MYIAYEDCVTLSFYVFLMKQRKILEWIFTEVQRIILCLKNLRFFFKLEFDCLDELHSFGARESIEFHWESAKRSTLTIIQMSCLNFEWGEA